MMNKKKTTYFLIAVAALIWGAIVFRIFKQMRPPEQPGISFTPITTNDNYFNKDSVYTLTLKYSDPFLKGSFSNVKTTANTKVKPATNRNIRSRINPQKQRSKEAPIVWPEIKFSGLIVNDKTNEKLGLVVVDQEPYLVKQGGQRNGVTLQELYTDSIRVGYKEQIKTFKKTD